MIYCRGGRYDQKYYITAWAVLLWQQYKKTVHLIADYIFTNERYLFFLIWTLKDTNQKIWLFKTRVINKSKTNIIKWIGLTLNSFNFLWATCSNHYTHICEHTEALAWYDLCSLTTKLLQTEMLCCRCYCMLHIYSYSVLSLNLEAMYAMSKHVSKCT